MNRLFYGLVPVCRKEFLHIVRDRGTLFFALLIPMLQLFLFGFAVDTNVRQIATVVLDESHTQESRRLLERFAGSDVFDLRIYAHSPAEMYEAIRGGRARAGIRIPVDYARRLQDGTSATVLVLVDGSDSSVAGQAVSTSTGVALQESLVRVLPTGALPIEVRPSVLYNPATRSANFFVPGLIAILLQIMTILLIALSLVRERERGTLEQLTMTPVAPLGLMVGKMIPYGVLAFGELCAILIVMVTIFQVPDSRQCRSIAGIVDSVPHDGSGAGAGDFHSGADAGRGFSVVDGHDTSVDLPVRLYLPDRKHAAVLSRNCAIDPRDLLHPDSARHHSAWRRHTRFVGACHRAYIDGLRDNSAGSPPVCKARGKISASATFRQPTPAPLPFAASWAGGSSR